MADTYLNLVNSPLPARIAKALGLPRPSVLRRYTEGEVLAPHPVLVAGAGAGADALAEVLLGWDIEVRRHVLPGEALSAAVVVLDAATEPAELAAPMLELGQAVRLLVPGGRVVGVLRSVADASGPAEAAARQGIDGALRSVAHELRAGATANGIILRGEATTTDAATLAALRFFLSGRSAYVDGQFIEVSAVPTGSVTDLAAATAAAGEGVSDQPLAGKTAVVTGAARGIGAEIARVLAREGARVVAVDVPAAGEQLAAVANSVRGTALQLDITAPEAAARILDHVRERFGVLDIVVHNAGITRDKLLANMDAARWDSVIAVNIASQLRMNEQFLASDAFSDTGRIISLASTSGIAGNRGQSNYAASKAGVIGMVRAQAAGFEGTGRTINAVAPGFIETDMTARIPPLTRQVARRLSSLQQGGLPVDVAETVAFLAAAAAAGINGQVVRVCGQNLVGA
ncbi:3-oxoacyl-ACP reductase [Arthrobacter agilis]|uniref:3-oxoacyl-ACP reductase n=1 Tax=Arthrobacter agilis TaxID=37921 RepID=UPI000B35036E|nr:3-oxoacyl-ACP reductase [Arthrobacter agilis]OUM44492.1 3-oxoacyl-ACP reductase [Arthrobacter agilis]PPB47397.1 3-oxoacyl-ACP reductase [Arthrobacter agilis]TPV22812.1 3-oxoacyl-ACP reductase [Arthrobacter agilis]VDR32062.1 3-oxoacyl-[acyl-carrier-protein] reductase FabG [Arthrobacter agilis]